LSETENPLAVAQFLHERPHLRPTLIFPERFLVSAETVNPAELIFREMLLNGQVDVALTLPQEPVLALLMDSDVAKTTGTMSPTGPFPPRFSWPEDAAEQVALARNHYRRRWGADPRGLWIPWGVTTESDRALLARLHIQWVVLPATPQSAGVFAGQYLPVIRPALFSTDVTGVLQISSFTDLQTLEKESEAPWILVSEILPQGTLSQWPPTEPWSDTVDFSPWIGHPGKNMAWRLLGITRKALEDFKNSGLATLHALDMATQEMYNAESGRYFFGLGNNDDDLKREFLGTLSHVYRLMNQKIPPALQRGLSGSSSVLSELESEPFFQRVGAGFRWQDPTGDHVASWDLTGFQVTPQGKTVAFQFELATSSHSEKDTFPGDIVPSVHVYIDINHLPNAGSLVPLPGLRGLVENPDAWEYVLSMTGGMGQLYRYAPGSAPKPVATFPLKKISNQSFRIDVSQQHLRGEPKGWGYGVVVTETGTPFSDVLASDGLSSDGQVPLREAHTRGQEIVIPFVRP
jgi:hypothetical protein